jgi:hypothetical protein
MYHGVVGGSKASIAAGDDDLQVATWTFNREIALYCVLTDSDERMEISYPMNFQRGNLPHTYPKTNAAETN